MFKLTGIWLLSLVLIALLVASVAADPCPVGDLDGNCRVDWQDVLRFAWQWLDPAQCSGAGCADLIGDDGVNMADFALLAQNWDQDWTGLLLVTIEPQAARDGGAQWRVDGGLWRDSGYTEQDVPIGQHNIEFKTGIAGWVRPADQQVQVDINQTTITSGTYTALTTANLLINEFMASNRDSLIDGDGRYSDWIELFNADSLEVDISGWYLTDNENDLSKWEFPDSFPPLSAGVGYPIVFASGKDDANYPYIDTSGYYHTNFRLNVGGEYLALVAPDGATIIHDYNSYECDVNEFGYPSQRRNYSYGIIDNDPDQESYFGPATPASLNANVLAGIVADTQFSVDRGFYETPFSVEITTETEGANIRYTLDCSEPTETHGTDYTGPIAVTGSTSLRAAAFKTDYLPTNVDTHTYIFLDDVLTQSDDQSALGLPSEWINGTGTSTPGQSNSYMVRDADYEIDPDVTLAKSDLTTIPSLSIVMNADDWFGEYTGIYTNSMMYASSDLFWEKCGSVELIYPNPNVGEEFQLNAGVRITGELARWPVVNKKQGLRLLFKGDYGPTKLRSSIFPNSDVDRYDTIVLRSHWGKSWLQDPYLTTYYPEYTATFLNADPTGATYIRDQYALDCWRDTGHISSEGRFVHLYINSLYWGIYEVIERADASFNAEHRGGDKEDYDVIKGSIPYTSVNGELHNGSRDMWNVLFSYFDFVGGTNQSTVTPVSDADYIEVQKYLDVEAFADYMLTLWTIGRFDFPRKNWYAAAKRGLPGQPPEKKFIFYVWDSEASLGDLYTSTKARYLDSTGTSDTGPVRLFKRLVPNTEFKMLFADRVHKYLFNNGALTPTPNTDRFMARANELDRAIVGESARWGDATITYADNPLTRDVEWVAERDRLLYQFFPDRTDVVIEQLRAVDLYPDVNAPVLHVNDANQHGGQIEADDVLSMTAEMETIWYTLDGSDPRVPVSGFEPPPPNSITLIEENALKRVLVPTVANGGDLLGTTWTGGDEPFDDSVWNDAVFISGRAGGVGYERGSGYQDFISYDVNDTMYNQQETCYIRIPFTIDAEDLPGFDSLTFRARYDDAFVVYINGTEVARSALVPSPLEWNSGADTWRSPETTAFDSFDISDHIDDDLKAGINIMAIHLLNAGSTSSDLLMSVELEADFTSSPPPPVQVSPTAINYTGTGPFTLAESTRLKARVLTDANEWSALSEAVFAVGPVAENLRITEIMYHPQDAPAGNPDAEFIELKNIGPETINLSLVRFTNGIDYTFGDTELASGEYIVVVKDRTAFEAEYGYGINVAAGQYTGSLANDGERIELEDAAGQTILNFRYRDGWCDITDGDGYSLTINDAAGDPNNWDEKKCWSASTFLGGSPGQPDNGPRYGDVVINEVLAHSNDDPNDWIELHNTTDGIIDITGWFLSDKASNLMKYQIPAATIPAHGYIVFTQDAHFGSEFKLSENGETVYLSSGLDIYGNLTGYRQQEDFGASEAGVAFGRYCKSTGTYNFVAMSENTPGPSYEGAANAYPEVGPIVINEIMYNPGPGRHSEEYIELYNLSGSAETLYVISESEPWKFTNGIDFTFPASPNEVTIDPGECLLVVKDPTAFTARYGSMPAGVEVVGPYDGLLANDGEKLEISKPGDEQDGTRYYIRIDRVNYSDGLHPDNCPGGVDLWPTEPDGDGNSLHRIFAQYYGNDPNNWQAAPPTPGVL